MSSNGNGWKPQKPQPFTCPSGQIVQIKTPGPEFVLRAGRVSRTFSKAAEREKLDATTPVTYGLDALVAMSDEELMTVMTFARQLVCAITVSPRLVEKPRPNSDEIGPSDVPTDDFWALFNEAMTGFLGFKIPVGDTEVEVKDLASFRGESGVQGRGVGSAPVSSDSQRTDEDRGLVGSTRD